MLVWRLPASDQITECTKGKGTAMKQQFLHENWEMRQIGKFATADVLGCTYESMPDSWALAKELETWFYFYKRVYRSISEESELRYIQELVCWYGDYLRQIK